MKRSEIFERTESAVESVCESSRDVVAVYLFGSFVRGEEDEQSDIDIGILFRDYSIDKLLKLFRRIDEELDIEREVDVRALNNSGPEFPFKVISEGKLLYESDASERADYEQYFERRYHDMKPLIEDYRSEMKARLV